MYCMECGNKLSGEAKFCGSCGKAVDQLNLSINVEGTFPSNEKKQNAWVELGKNKSPNAHESSQTFYKMLWNEKSIRILTYLSIGVIASASLVLVMQTINKPISTTTVVSSIAKQPAASTSPQDNKPISTTTVVSSIAKQPAASTSPQDNQTAESIDADVILQRNGNTFYAANKKICGKANGMTAHYVEGIATKYSISTNSISLLRVNAGYDGKTCNAVIDTPNGPITCIIGSIVNPAGNTHQYLVSAYIKFSDGREYLALGMCTKI